MFKTILIAVSAVNAIKITQEAAAVEPITVTATAAAVEAMVETVAAGEFTKDDVIKTFEEHMPEGTTGDDIKTAIDFAAEKGMDKETVEAMIEGAEISGAFDKHDIYNFAMETCAKFEVTPENLDEMLNYAGEKMGIDAEEGEALLEKIGEAFDISEEEFSNAMDDCFAAGAAAGEDMPAKEGEAPVEPVKEEGEAPVKEEGEAPVEPVKEEGEAPVKEEGEAPVATETAMVLA